MSAPSYYCPAGIERPGHIRLRAGVPRQPGPDGATGTIYGKPYDNADAWHQADAGWWVCMDGCEKHDLMRTNAMPGPTVDGWVVPHLIRSDGTSAVGYVAPGGFAVPRALAPLIDDLRALRDFTGLVQWPHAELAARILGLNYHVSLVEIGLAQWLPLTAVWNIILGAHGLDPATAETLANAG